MSVHCLKYTAASRLQWKMDVLTYLIRRRHHLNKIIRQIRKNKTKVEKKLKDTAFKEAFAEPVPEDNDYEIIKYKKFKMRPMDVEEAILQMNLLDHQFFMFTNAKTGQINVVYLRDDGNYAVLEPDND